MNYLFVDDVKNHKHLKHELYKLIENHPSKTTFDNWMLKGNNDISYRYFGLTDLKERLLITVGVKRTTLFFQNKPYSAIHIGNVFFASNSWTNLEKINLEKQLLNQIKNKYINIVDFVYTYQANIDPMLLEEFQLKEVEEVQYYLDAEILKRKRTRFKNLNLKNYSERLQLLKMIRHTELISKKGLDLFQDTTIRFYNILKYYPERVYSIPSLNAMVVLELKKGICELIGIFSKTQVDLKSILESIIPESAKVVEFGFDPSTLITNLKMKAKEKQQYQENIFGTSKLYIGSSMPSFDEKTIMFPLLSRQK